MKLLLTFFRIHITQTHRRKKKSSPHFPTYQSFISYRYVGLTDLLLVTHQMKWRITAKPIPISTHLCWHIKWTNWPSPLKLFLVVINKNKARILNRIHTYKDPKSIELVENTAHRLGTLFGLPNHFHLTQCVM